LIYISFGLMIIVILFCQTVLLFKIFRKSPIKYEQVRHSPKPATKLISTPTGEYILRDKIDPTINDDATLAELEQ